jgi:hypothetical protein
MKMRFIATLIILVILLLPLVARGSWQYSSTLYDNTSVSDGCFQSTQSKVLTISVSGNPVNISFTIYEDSENVPVKTLTLTDTTPKKLIKSAPFDSLKVDWTITSGTVDSVTLKCGWKP